MSPKQQDDLFLKLHDREGEDGMDDESEKVNTMTNLKLVHSPITPTNLSPQTIFQLSLKKRGYSPQLYSYKRSSYYNKPTDYQQASYGSAIIYVVKQGKPEDFRLMMETGLSPNACNQHGESILHMICRHGKADHFHVLLEFGVDVQQTDDYGRTPMHDCCWAARPCFEIARKLLELDSSMLFILDIHGSVPLTYVTKKNWGAWNRFLGQVMDDIFPVTNGNKDDAPPFCCADPDTRPVPDPVDPLPKEVAAMIANGEMQPDDIEVIEEDIVDDDSSIDDDDSSIDVRGT